MKIFVFTHRLETGGIQTNAIDLSRRLRDQFGHEVVIFAVPGAMVKVAEENGIRVIQAPHTKSALSLTMMRALRAAVRSERPHVIHVWDYGGRQSIDAFFAAHLLMGIPIVVTDMMSDRMIRSLPRSVVTTFGTPEFVDLGRAGGCKRAELLLPPVDVRLDAPNLVDPRLFREQHGIRSGDFVLVTVSRLVAELKGESLRQTIGAVRVLGRDLPLRLIMVGDGDARADLERLAAQTNADLGRSAVVLTGELRDPRPAYAAADVVIGMGGSALRGMAFGKPTIIVGTKGFSATFNRETASFFYYHGMFGSGGGSQSNDRLIGDIRALLGSASDLPALGAFSREFVVNHFALETVCSQLDRYCRTALTSRPSIFVTAADGLRILYLLRFPDPIAGRVKRVIKRLLEGSIRNSAKVTLCL